MAAKVDNHRWQDGADGCYCHCLRQDRTDRSRPAPRAVLVVRNDRSGSNAEVQTDPLPIGDDKAGSQAIPPGRQGHRGCVGLRSAVREITHNPSNPWRLSRLENAI